MPATQSCQERGGGGDAELAWEREASPRGPGPRGAVLTEGPGMSLSRASCDPGPFCGQCGVTDTVWVLSQSRDLLLLLCVCVCVSSLTLPKDSDGIWPGLPILPAFVLPITNVTGSQPCARH